MKNKLLLNLLGGGILAFGMYNVHALSGVTEGGILGLTLLLNRWFSVSPAWSGLILNGICYLIGWRTMGKEFLLYSAVSAGSFSLFYRIFEQFPQVYPPLAEHPFVAAIIGAVFVGVSIGICVRANGAPSGDDALAMSISKLTGIGIQWAYLAGDLTVLLLSISYMNWRQLLASFITCLLSGQIIGWMQPKEKK